ncbi:MAG: prepilin-type N-terminal cleavage/methylation domain-containing protein, partial [Planctomycetota bacterium]
SQIVRRGFTMLETVLAVAVGSLVVAAAFGVIATVRTSERALADQSHDMNSLARTQLAVRQALDTIHAAPPGTVRQSMNDANEDAATAVLNTAFPEAIPGLAARLEMTTGTNPRLEVVLGQPLLDSPTPVQAGGNAGQLGSLAAIAAEQLPGHRGAFELRRGDDDEFPSLWWVPLPPRDIPMGVIFDESSLPRPRKLCGDVRGLTWTAFIDSERVPLVRAIEKSQLPAYIELEIETAGGGYGNWMFELGWTVGPELQAPPGDATNAANEVETEDNIIESDPGAPGNAPVPADFDPGSLMTNPAVRG